MRGEARQVARIQPRLPTAPLVEELEAQRAELVLELVDELEMLPYAWNCASSVEPFSASVDASGDTAWVIRSK